MNSPLTDASPFLFFIAIVIIVYDGIKTKWLYHMQTKFKLYTPEEWPLKLKARSDEGLILHKVGLMAVALGMMFLIIGIVT